MRCIYTRHDKSDKLRDISIIPIILLFTDYVVVRIELLYYTYQCFFFKFPFVKHYIDRLAV